MTPEYPEYRDIGWYTAIFWFHQTLPHHTLSNWSRKRRLPQKDYTYVMSQCQSLCEGHQEISPTRGGGIVQILPPSLTTWADSLVTWSTALKLQDVVSCEAIYWWWRKPSILLTQREDWNTFLLQDDIRHTVHTTWNLQAFLELDTDHSGKVEFSELEAFGKSKARWTMAWNRYWIQLFRGS